MKTRLLKTNWFVRQPADFTWVNYPCSGPTTTASQTFGLLEVCRDTLEEGIHNSTNGRKNANACWHRRLHQKIIPGSAQHVFSSVGSNGAGTTSFGSLPGQNDLLSSIFGEEQRLWNVTDPKGVYNPPRWSFDMPVDSELSLIEDCYQKARGLKSDVVLNIIEANQIWPSLKSLITCIPEMAYHWGRARKVVRTASGAFLAWKFGMSPFLQDMSSLWKYIPRMRDDLKRHNDGIKSRFSAVRRYSANLDSTPVVWSTTNGYANHLLTYQARVTKSPSIRYVLVVEPNLKYSSSIFNGADKLMSSLGTGPASLAWEKVPWSFVADWFVDLRGWLRMLDDAIVAPPYKVIAFTRSNSYKLSTDVFESRHSPCSGASFYNSKGSETEYSHYERSIVPLGYSAPTWSGRFGKNQAAIMAALIAQKLSGSKRR